VLIRPKITIRDKVCSSNCFFFTTEILKRRNAHLVQALETFELVDLDESVERIGIVDSRGGTARRGDQGPRTFFLDDDPGEEGTKQEM
jgi:hypothetical protein